jgi:hypothetical protein
MHMVLSSRSSFHKNKHFRESLLRKRFISDTKFKYDTKYIKSKAIPVANFGGPYSCETLRSPHFVDNQVKDGGEIVSFTRQPRSTPQESSLYSFLLEAESFPGP